MRGLGCEVHGSGDGSGPTTNGVLNVSSGYPSVDGVSCAELELLDPSLLRRKRGMRKDRPVLRMSRCTKPLRGCAVMEFST